MTDVDVVPGHAFISYVREDTQAVDKLQSVLEAAGVRVWRDNTADLWPGQDWRTRIRQAITADALAFIACFSRNSVRRGKTYQNEELTLAVEQVRQRQPSDSWLIPVRLDDCVKVRPIRPAWAGLPGSAAIRDCDQPVVRVTEQVSADRHADHADWADESWPVRLPVPGTAEYLVNRDLDVGDSPGEHRAIPRKRAGGRARPVRPP
jgi:TIR domain